MIKMIKVYKITGITKTGHDITIYRDAPNHEKAIMIASRKLKQIDSCEPMVKDD